GGYPPAIGFQNVAPGRVPALDPTVGHAGPVVPAGSLPNAPWVHRMNTMQWKIALVAVAVLVSAYVLWPTVSFYQLPQAERLSPSKDTPTARLRDKAIPLGLDLQGGMHLVLEVDASKLPPEEAKGAVDRAMEVIRNRIDQFGVAEPIIQKEGTDRIVVQLPGLSDRQRAIDLI